jgi:excisionase family DNA binding protein
MTITAIPVALTIPQAAEAVGVSERQAYYLIKHHGLPTRKVGGRTRIPVRLLAEWVEAQPVSDMRQHGATAEAEAA